MNIKKLLAAAVIAVIGSASAFAQKVEFHGYMDYSAYLGAYGTQDGDADWVQSDIYAMYGSWYGGRTEANMTVTAKDFLFSFGLRLGNDLDTWYDLYGDDVAFFKGNMRIDFLSGMIRYHVGKYEEESFGYHIGGLAWGNAYGNDFAVRGSSFYFTGVELKPFTLVDGLTAIVGLPIQADCFNDGITEIDVDDEIVTLLKQFKAGIKYAAPFGMTFMAGYMNANFDVAATTYEIDTSKFREAWLNIDSANLFKTGISLRAGYDFQQRLADSGAMKHNVMLSAAYKPLPKLWTALDGRMAYATGNFEAVARDILLYKGQLKATYDLPKQVQVGLLGNVSWISDSSGRLGTGEVAGDNGDLGFSINHTALKMPAPVMNGFEGASLGWGVNPYVQYNFSNGYVSLGYILQSNSYTSDTTNQALTMAIPLNACFWY